MGFTGWPAEAFELYVGLEADNSRTYWHARRDVYDNAVRAPFADLSDAVAKRFGPLRVFRPNRDIRFSRDKSPYKTAAAAATESPGGASYYVQVSAEGMFVGCGMYHMAPDQLERWRAALDNSRAGAQLERIVADVRAKRYEIGAMESLKSAPRGYAKDHPRIDLLRMKGLTMGRSFPLARWMHTAKALDRIVAAWDDATPMNRWLEQKVGPSTLPPREPD
ncbi:MAG: hypothetical protein QOI55_1881 [Actinomycetota bacterium]|nr:hypothetical protein [Actinomycetota bacterium]